MLDTFEVKRITSNRDHVAGKLCCSCSKLMNCQGHAWTIWSSAKYWSTDPKFKFLDYFCSEECCNLFILKEM